MSEKVTKISPEALREVEAALKTYLDEVIAADLSDWSKDVYTYHSTNFVRWLTGDFSPGSRGAPYARPKSVRKAQDGPPSQLEAGTAKKRTPGS